MSGAPFVRAPDVVETPRLVLRRFDLDRDVDAMASIYADPEVVPYIGDGRTATRDETIAWLERNERERWDVHGYGQWAVVDRRSTSVIGRCGLQPLEGGPEVEVGYVLARSSWGNGYATEAGRAALRIGLGEMGLDRIVAVVHVDNVASQRVIDRLGMRYERDGTFYGNPCRYYVTPRAAWFEAQADTWSDAGEAETGAG